MIVALIQIISQPEVIITSWVEALSVLSALTIFTGAITAYRHIECNYNGCHRPGRHPHGHLKLCKKHHPKINGLIGQKHIDAVTAELEAK